jgi:hypothetical protein
MYEEGNFDTDRSKTYFKLYPKGLRRIEVYR